MNQLLGQLGGISWVKILLFGIVAGALYYFTLFDDGTQVMEQIKVASAELATADLQLKKMEKDLENTNRFEKEVKATAIQFEKVTNIMPEKMDAAELQSIIGQNVAVSGVRTKQIDPKRPDEKREFYEVTRVQLSLEGTFAQLVTFLSQISRVPRLLTFDSVELVALPVKDSEAQRLSFSGLLSGYRYNKNAVPKAPGKEGDKAAPPNGGTK